MWSFLSLSLYIYNFVCPNLHGCKETAVIVHFISVLPCKFEVHLYSNSHPLVNGTIDIDGITVLESNSLLRSLGRVRFLERDRERTSFIYNKRGMDNCAST